MISGDHAGNSFPLREGVEAVKTDVSGGAF